MLLNYLADVGTLAAAIAAFWAAFEARRAATASRIAIEAQVVYVGVSEYFQPQMAEAIQTLRAWEERHRGSFATTWLQEYKQAPRTQGSANVFAAKRHVKQFFVKADRLYSNGLISVAALRAIARVHGVNVFYDIVKDLDIAQNPDVDLGPYERLEEVIGRYESRPPRA